MGSVVLVAASGLAREVLALVEQLPPLRVIGILDDEPGLQGTRVSGVPVVGLIADANRFPDATLLICAGRGQTRRAIARRLAEGGIGTERFATVIDPLVRIPPGCRVGAGSILLAGSVLTANVTLGCHVVVMPNVTLTHDDVIGDYGTLCAGVSLGGSVTVGEAAYLGMNAAVRERVTVGAGAVVGMGACVLSDIPQHETWVGAPARCLSLVSPW